MNNTITMKRFEIVLGIEQLEDLMDLLEKSGVRGDVLMEQENIVVILACKEDQAQRVVNELRPALKSFGGMCLISDSLWLEGPAISY